MTTGLGVPLTRTVIWALVVCFGLVLWRDAGAAQGLERDLAYGPGANQRLDLSVPAAQGFPTVLFIHGGSLTGGDKADDDYRNVCAAFPDAGIACANVNYRLAPVHGWPAQAEDVAAAVAWVRTNIERRSGDPHKLFMVGHSSGAMLVALVSTDARFLARHGLTSNDLRGIVPMGSIMWDDGMDQALRQNARGRVEEAFGRDSQQKIYASLDAYQDQWPIRHIRAGLPPFLFLIAESEQEHPPVLMTNRKFVEAARVLGNSAEYKVLAGRTHYSAIRKLHEPGDPVFVVVRDFVRQFSGASRP